MHGVKRSRIPVVPDPSQLQQEKSLREAAKIAHYQKLLSELNTRKSTLDYSSEALQLTTTILLLNPEFQTGWNYRRRILLFGLFPNSSQEAIQAYLSADLDLTNRSLKSNPKNYTVWEYRKWVLETMPEADWTREMMIVEGYLERDGRNFHSWDYRRYLISSILSLPPPIVEDGQGEKSRKEMKKPTTRSELNYTTQKISSNFSNFSAWHYRTKLLIKLWDEEAKEGKGVEEKEKKIESEFDLVKQAMWSDPNDQSAWLYHRWLVGKGTIPIVRREIQGIEELLEEEPDSRWSLDSLIYYKKLLKALLLSSPTSVNLDQEILELDSDRTEMLKKLQLVDPMRKNRYEDLIKDLSL